MHQERNVRWNFNLALIDAMGWGLGMGLISTSTILPVFVGKLTRSPEAVGMIQAVMYLGWLVPGILVAGWVERLARVKTPLMCIAALERVMLLLMVPACIWLGPQNPTGLLIAFFVCWGVMHFAVGVNTPSYYKLIAKTIPSGLRGRLYGIGGAGSGLLGMVAAAPAAWFLREWGYPNGYALCFGAAFVAQSLSVLPLAFIEEPAQPPEAVPRRLGPRDVLAVVRQDPRLLWLCLAIALFSLNQMATAFYALYSQTRFHASDATIAGAFTATQMGAKTVAFLLVGWLGDRFGNRAALRLATVAGVAAAATALLTPSLAGMYAVFALNELAVQGWGVCAINYVLELCRPERSSTYIAVYGLLSGPFRVVLPLLGGVLAERLGWGALFGTAVAGGAITLLLLHRHVPEPRHQAAVEG